MTALGLIQHISQTTHNQGNTLDHIYTESIDMLGVRHSFIGEYLSDHRLVRIEINKKKIPVLLDNKPRRQFKKLDVENFTKVFNNEIVLKHSKLEDIWSTLLKELNRTLDEIIPIEDQKKIRKPPKPWYTPSLLDQRKIVRGRERTFIKYREDQHWWAFTRERNRYTRMIRFNKRNSFPGSMFLVGSFSNNLGLLQIACI